VVQHRGPVPPAGTAEGGAAADLPGAGRLDAQTRQVTRLTNQLHHLLARAFPELALLTKDLAAGWVLKLLDLYPTAARIAAARPASLEAVPYLPHHLVPALRERARSSIASLNGPVAEQLVRDQVGQLREAHKRQKSLEKLLVAAYRDLPADGRHAEFFGDEGRVERELRHPRHGGEQSVGHAAVAAHRVGRSFAPDERNVEPLSASAPGA
jgi:hypothetical protein